MINELTASCEKYCQSPRVAFVSRLNESQCKAAQVWSDHALTSAQFLATLCSIHLYKSWLLCAQYVCTNPTYSVLNTSVRLHATVSSEQLTNPGYSVLNTSVQILATLCAIHLCKSWLLCVQYVCTNPSYSVLNTSVRLYATVCSIHLYKSRLLCAQ